MSRPEPPSAPHQDAEDATLRAQLRQLRAPQADSQALQQRVLAQWRSQAGTLGSASQPNGSGTLAWRGGPVGLGERLLARLGRRAGLALALLAVLTALSAWWLRPDPALQELLQPDVLSQMGLGEL